MTIRIHKIEQERNQLLAALKAMVSDCAALEGRFQTVINARDLIEEIETGETK